MKLYESRKFQNDAINDVKQISSNGMICQRNLRDRLQISICDFNIFPSTYGPDT